MRHRVRKPYSIGVIRDQLHRDRQAHGRDLRDDRFWLIWTAWRGFLSLRDPAGAAHMAGPPSKMRDTTVMFALLNRLIPPGG